MSKKILKKQAKEFNEKFTKQILELGAKPIDSRSSLSISFELETIVGRLEIHLPIEHTYCFTVFSCFDDVAKAKEKFDCNPYSGKYNRHITHTMNAVEAVESAMFHFECTIPEQAI